MTQGQEQAEEADQVQATEGELAYAFGVLDAYFEDVPLSKLVTTTRQFPGHMRVDVQAALDKLLGAHVDLFGLAEAQYETLSFARLLSDDRAAVAIAPLQYSEVDVGESSPSRCLDNGLWLCELDGLRYAILLCANREPGRQSGVRIEIMVPAGSAGATLVQRCFGELENAVQASRTYRGKILSLRRLPTTAASPAASMCTGCRPSNAPR